MTAKRAVLFDLDGTLVHTLPDIAASMNRVLADHGLPVHPEDAYRYFTGDGAVNLTRRALGEAHAALADTVLAEYSRLYAVHCRDTSHVYAGIPELLNRLRGAGLHLAVLSNKDDGDVASVLRYYFPDAPFVLCRGRRPGIPIKPDPAPALALAAELGVAPADFWYLGDTPTDLACAQAAGMDFIGAGWGFRMPRELRDAGASRVAETPEDAGKIMLG